MEADSIAKNWSFIPEFYFDLISRIPTGLFLFLILLFEFGAIKSVSFELLSKLEAGPSFLLLFISIVVGQTLGIFLSVIGKRVSEIVYSDTIFNNYLKQESQLFDWFRTNQKIMLKKSDEINPKESHFIYREITEYVKKNSGRSSSILPKLSAETSVCNNSVAAILIALIVHILHSIFYNQNAFYQCGFYLWAILLIAILLWLGKERYERMIKTLFALLRNIYIEKNVSTIQNKV